MEKNLDDYVTKKCVHCGMDGAFELKKGGLTAYKCFNCNHLEIVTKENEKVDVLDPLVFFFNANNANFYGLSMEQLKVVVDTMDLYRATVHAFNIIPNNLSKNGFSDRSDIELKTQLLTCDSESKIELFEKVNKWINDNLVQAKTKFKGSSYTLKHECERSIGEYVANGTFIMAMILMGYKYERLKDTPNALFYCRPKNK